MCKWKITISGHGSKMTLSLDESVIELWTLAKNCEFINVDREILQEVTQNYKSNQLRRRVLRELDKTVNYILTEQTRTITKCD